MYTGADPHESRVFLRDIGWELYESLLAVHREKRVPHFTYYRNTLEIMRPGLKHEYINGLIDMIIHFWSYEIKVETHGFGSATYLRKDLQMGFEVDSSFYIQSVGSIQGRCDLDMTTDPPPDLIVDI